MNFSFPVFFFLSFFLSFLLAFLRLREFFFSAVSLPHSIELSKLADFSLSFFWSPPSRNMEKVRIRIKKEKSCLHLGFLSLPSNKSKANISMRKEKRHNTNSDKTSRNILCNANITSLPTYQRTYVMCAKNFHLFHSISLTITTRLSSGQLKTFHRKFFLYRL